MARGLGEFEQLLLFAVLRLDPDAYGVSIRREIERRTGRNISAGAIYTGLDRLQSRGYVSARKGETTPARGGRRRKYYRLEPEGAAALHASYENVRRMAAGVTTDLAARTTGSGRGR